MCKMRASHAARRQKVSALRKAGRGMIPVMGVDPGVNGGLAVLDKFGEPVYTAAFRNYWTHRQLVESVVSGFVALRAIRYGYPPALTSRTVYVETVGYIGRRPGREKGDGGKGAFTFGQVAGLIRGALHAVDADVREALPMTWQSRMKCLSGGDKNVTKARAMELYPQIKMTHYIADALLIARYGWERMCL